MFTRSHLQELKRRYASIYALPVEEKVIEDGTDEGAKKYKKDTPGQDIEKEFKEHCGVCGEQGIKEDEIEEEDSETADTSEETPNETKEGEDSEGGVE